MSEFSELKTYLERLGDSVDTFTDSYRSHAERLGRENAGLQDRLEELEARASQPTRGGQGQKPEYKVYRTASGMIYELPATVKMADALPEEKTPEISLERWLAATVAGERCGDKEAVEYTREQKQIVTTTTGVIIPQEYQTQWIDLIRARMVLNTAGMTTVTMESKTLNASAVATDPTASWHTEAGAISIANPTFAARTLTAETLVTRCQASVEVAQDSPSFGAQLASVMTKAMAVELDRVGLVGSGTPPEPQGIFGTSGIGQVTGVGAIGDYAEMLTGVKTLLDANVPLETATASVVMAPSVWEDFESLPTGISSDKTQLPRPAALQNTRFLVTGHNLNDSSSPAGTTAFMGDFSDLVLGVRRESSVEVLKLSAYAGNLLLEFIGYLRADFLVRRPASFVTLEGITI